MNDVYAISYKDRKNAYIVVRKLDKPYGPNSSPVISIGCTLKGDVENPTWKVHIPTDMVEDLSLAIKWAMEDEKPIDKAIKGKEEEYEDELELYETYGGD